MATDKQLEALTKFRRNLSDLARRRREWQGAATQIGKILAERVRELKEETDFSLVLHEQGSDDDRALQLGVGRRTIRKAGEQVTTETGALLFIGLTMSGHVRFTFVPSFIGKEDDAKRKTLGTEEPDEAAMKVDDYLAAFLERAVKTHCSVRRR